MGEVSKPHYHIIYQGGEFHMKDLVHIFELEDLLQEANNALIRQAKADGKRVLG